MLLAQAPEAQAEGPGFQRVILMFAVVIEVFYFIVFRPQVKEQKKKQSMLEGIKRGDEVVTSSGIIGSVADLQENIVTVEVAKNVKVRFLKSAISATGPIKKETSSASEPAKSKS